MLLTTLQYKLRTLLTVSIYRNCGREKVSNLPKPCNGGNQYRCLHYLSPIYSSLNPCDSHFCPLLFTSEADFMKVTNDVYIHLLVLDGYLSSIRYYWVCLQSLNHFLNALSTVLEFFFNRVDISAHPLIILLFGVS